MLAKAADDLDLANQVPRLCEAASSFRKTADALSEAVNSMEATYSNELGFGEIRYIRRGIRWKAVGLGVLGWATAALLIYLHVKGHF
jgi:hypothetical protein